MPKFEAYNIVLKDLSNGTHTFEYKLDNEYFKKIDSPEVQKGDLKAKATVSVHESSFDVNFEVEGTIFIPCDRCLDEMEQYISGHEEIQVKFGENFGDEGDAVIIPEKEGTLNIAWFLYEIIVLAIPIKHVHAPGLCNKTMVGKLKRHLTREDGDDDNVMDDSEAETYTDEDQTDPRWDSLKSILE